MTIESRKRDVALVVDDSPETLRLLTDALDGAGMTVMVALDGASAMRIVEQITPDIVLLDAVMPGTDGFETCRRLKGDAGLDNVPIIFMTGLSETEHIVRGLEAGGVDYVTKPIVVEEMLARIRVHLANARMTQSARAALDVSGRYLLAVNDQGRILWATPQAQKLLSDTVDGDEVVLPDPIPVGWRRRRGARQDQRRRTSRRFPAMSSSGCNIWASLAPTSSCCGWRKTPVPTCLRNSLASWD
jgi:CheY-like chemotaxis protein